MPQLEVGRGGKKGVGLGIIIVRIVWVQTASPPIGLDSVWLK